MSVVGRAADFIWRNARLLERTLSACRFLDGPAEQVRAAVRAYRNPDGGFGQALEPDIRGPVSQPLHGEVALRALQIAGVRDGELAAGLCDFLASITPDGGPAPVALPSMLEYPRAAHWSSLDPVGDSPNPTAALAGMLWYQGVRHPWLEGATEWCWRRLEQPLDEAHDIRAALTFLEYAPDRQRAEALAVTVTRAAYGAAYFVIDPRAETYGLTPLHLVPSPGAVGRVAFPDDLLARQQDDGGWPITWTPPSAAGVQEWRGVWTLEALTTLRAYGRI